MTGCCLDPQEDEAVDLLHKLPFFLLEEFSCTHSVSLCISSGAISDMLSFIRSRHLRDAESRKIKGQ